MMSGQQVIETNKRALGSDTEEEDVAKRQKSKDVASHDSDNAVVEHLSTDAVQDQQPAPQQASQDNEAPDKESQAEPLKDSADDHAEPAEKDTQAEVTIDTAGSEQAADSQSHTTETLESTKTDEQALPKTGFGRFGSVASSIKGGFGAAASAVPAAGFGGGFKSAANANGGGGIWAKAANPFAQSGAFQKEKAASIAPPPLFGQKPTSAAASDEEGSDVPDDAEEEQTLPIEKKELPPGLSEDYEYRTGEEDERTVFHCRARLHVLDMSTKNWKSMGEGQLNMNERPASASEGGVNTRLVLRSLGAMKLLLNVRLFDGMAVERVGPKQTRLMALEQDNGSLKPCTYLLTTAMADCDTLYEEITSRVNVVSAAEAKAPAVKNENGTAGDITFTRGNLSNE